jgi:vacuolar-type H+-ATPase subunit H
VSKLDDLISRLREEERRALGDARVHEERLEEATRKLELVQAKLLGVLEAKRLTDTEPPKALKQPQKRSRSLSGHWKRIMQAVHGDEFGYDELAMMADVIGHQVGRDTLRSQMSLYKSAGLVESTDSGKFRLTEAGIKAAAIDPNNKAPDVEASGARNGRVAELEGPEKTEQHPFRKGENVGSSPTPPASLPDEGPPAGWDLDDDVPF